MAELLDDVEAEAATTAPLVAMERLGVAMADPIRQMLLLRLAHGPAYPSDLADLVDTSRSNLSNHLSCLRGCGLVVAEREGRRIRYELVTRRLGETLLLLQEATEAAMEVPTDGC